MRSGPPPHTHPTDKIIPLLTLTVDITNLENTVRVYPHINANFTRNMPTNFKKVIINVKPIFTSTIIREYRI